MAKWYWMKDGQKHGPIDTAGLRKLAESGQLQPLDNIWREGLREWVPASEAKGLDFGAIERAEFGETIKYRCCFCRALLESSAAIAGRKDTCPRCGRTTPVPRQSIELGVASPKGVPPWAFRVGAGILFLLIAGISLWAAFRDTWQRDNAARFAQLGESVPALVREGRLAEAIANYDEMARIRGNRRLDDTYLADILATATKSARLAKQKMEAGRLAPEKQHVSPAEPHQKPNRSDPKSAEDTSSPRLPVPLPTIGADTTAVETDPQERKSFPAAAQKLIAFYVRDEPTAKALTQRACSAEKLAVGDYKLWTDDQFLAILEDHIRKYSDSRVSRPTLVRLVLTSLRNAAVVLHLRGQSPTSGKAAGRARENDEAVLSHVMKAHFHFALSDQGRTLAGIIGLAAKYPNNKVVNDIANCIRTGQFPGRFPIASLDSSYALSYWMAQRQAIGLSLEDIYATIADSPANMQYLDVVSSSVFADNSDAFMRECVPIIAMTPSLMTLSSKGDLSVWDIAAALLKGPGKFSRPPEMAEIGAECTFALFFAPNDESSRRNALKEAIARVGLPSARTEDAVNEVLSSLNEAYADFGGCRRILDVYSVTTVRAVQQDLAARSKE